MHDPEPNFPADGAFEDAPISRRQFVKLSAATGGMLAAPGQGTADVSSDRFDDEYQYVLNHTPRDYGVPTLIEFTDESGIGAFEALDVGEELHSTTTPTTAAYAQVTASEAALAADLPTAEELSYTPGSNPFWRLDYYPMGVFPSPERAVDYIGYHQMVSGMEHLESEHPEQLLFYALGGAENPHSDAVSFGQSPGHYNRVSARRDPKALHVAELTNPPEGYDTMEEFRGTEAFEQRQKVMFEGPMHGLERPGPEACFRFVERVLRGEETDIERMLDECVIVILSVNPDGWVARKPMYDSNGVPAAPAYERGNAEVGDTNRQYPTIGWIDPNHHPGEPDEERWAEDNPHDIIDMVPDAMGAVEHFREYENLTHGADLHGMAHSENFVLGLINQIEFTQDEFHDLYEMNHVLGESMEGELDNWDALADVQQSITGDFNAEAAGFGVLPESAYDYSTIWDTLGYTTTGALIGFMGASEERGGLDVTTLAFEMAIGAGTVYEPVLVDMWVTGYLECMRAVTEYALRDVESELATPDGEPTTVAFVDSETIVRSSEDLEFLQNDPDNESTNTTLRQTSRDVDLAAGATESVTIDVEEGLHTLSVHTHTDGLADVVLRDPAGEERRAYRPSTLNGPHHVYEPFNVKQPAAGEWTVELSSLMADGTESVQLQVVGMQSATAHPDPRDALGFEQAPYEVTPTVFFEDLEADNELVEVQGLAPGDVVGGVDADHLVVIHDDRGDDPAAYVDAIDGFVEAGGNLVLTDAGLHLLEDMATAPSIEDGDVVDDSFGVGHLEAKADDHPLLTDTRPIQHMTYKVAPLGIAYAEDAPMTLVDADSWADAGGTIAGTTGGQVSAGSIFTDDEDWQGIHAIGGLLPPASQTELHPFGLKNYVLAYFGFTVFANALGVEQRRFVDGELVRTIGDADQAPAAGDPGDPTGDLAADGAREIDSSVVTGRQAYRVELTLESVTGTDSERVDVQEAYPEEWRFLARFSDGEAIDDTRITFGDVEVDGDEDESVDSFTYFLESPDDVDQSGPYTVGPGRVLVDDEEAEFAGTDDVLAVAMDL